MLTHEGRETWEMVTPEGKETWKMLTHDGEGMDPCYDY